MQVLQAIEDGQITAAEAARLLDALAGKGGGAEPPLRLRVVETATERVRVDLAIPLALLESFAALGLHPDVLWGLSGEVDAGSVVAAARSGRKGVLAEARDEARGTRVELIAEEG